MEQGDSTPVRPSLWIWSIKLQSMNSMTIQIA